MSLVSLKTELRQDLKLTPQLLQSMEILQMNTQELTEFLQKAAEENPLLEQESPSSLADEYEELLRRATRLEHHPDNVAPALYGSLCASFMENGMPYTAQFAVHEKFRFVTIIPDYEVRTEDARRILPSDMSYADAIYQMGRCATLGKALESGDEEMVRHACIDRMQEPYRSRLIPEYDEVKRLCMDLGALAFVISGSGSTMLAVCTADTGGKLCRQLSERFRSWQVLELKAAAEGGAFEIHE